MRLLFLSTILLVLVITVLIYFIIEKNIIVFLSYFLITGIYLLSIFLFDLWHKTKQNMVVELLALTGGKFFITIVYLFILKLTSEPTIFTVAYTLFYYALLLLLETLYIKKKLNS
ncbi:MAG: hypothetical protein N2Z72_00990 [Bacteroidales bacterium]|nr:hypothetical protein [Bacteroidales bacterium]